ncbi:CaiB/BaiF CoA transferase family protein [Neptunomonas marina]|nr:CaiB/BaiF CoA-transferase family protein [Neptunomonas marina]
MKPLAGLKVLDLSTLLPGPYATMLLADMGAEVLRVESPSRPDLVREMKPSVGRQSASFAYLNRGKRSIALNLKHEQARQVVHALIEEFDIVVEQFRPGVMARLGLDYEALAQINPKLIYCAITGFGQHGSRAHAAGHDINYLALSGISSASNGHLSSVQIADVAGGSQPAVMAILAAVIQRQTTGEGQFIDIAMSDQCVALQPLMMPVSLNSDADFVGDDHFLSGGGIYDYYETSDGYHIAVGSLEPQFRYRLLERLDQLALNDKPDSEVKGVLQALFKQQTRSHWVSELAGIDACVEPVLTPQEVPKELHHQERALFVQGDEGDIQVRPTPLLSGMSHDSLSPAPDLGADTQSVLAEIGINEKDYQALKASGLFD